MGNIRIRTTRISDIDQLVKVERRSYWSGYSHWKASSFTEYLNRKSVIAIVACDGADIIGKAMGVIYKRDGSIRFDVYDVSVLPDYRGIGIGERLLRTLERRARRLDSVSSSLYVRFNNHKALCLYRKFGYSSVVCGNRWGLKRMVKYFN